MGSGYTACMVWSHQEAVVTQAWGWELKSSRMTRRWDLSQARKQCCEFESQQVSTSLLKVSLPAFPMPSVPRRNGSWGQRAFGMSFQ